MRQFIVIERRATAEREALWLVTHGSEVHGGYLSEWAAVLNAIDHAREETAGRVAAEVLVQRSCGASELRWRVAAPKPARRTRRRAS
jgi:hypothetical protein